MVLICNLGFSCSNQQPKIFLAVSLFFKQQNLSVFCVCVCVCFSTFSLIAPFQRYYKIKQLCCMFVCLCVEYIQKANVGVSLFFCKNFCKLYFFFFQKLYWLKSSKSICQRSDKSILFFGYKQQIIGISSNLFGI